MSLKDRFQSTEKTQNTKQQKPTNAQVQYYLSGIDEDGVNSLGILETILYDDDLNSIFVSGAKNIYVERNGKTHKSTSTYRDNVQLANIIKKLALNNDIDIENEGYSAKFNHKRGININITIPPLSSVVSFFIKVYNDKHATVQKFQDDLIISKELALLLECFSAIGKNILITGERNTLKTTLLSAMAKKVPTNLRAVFLDNEYEVKIEKQNFTNYDLQKIDDKEVLENILKMVFNSTIDKVFLNCADEKILHNVIDKIQNGFRGLTCTIDAKNPKNAMENLAKIVYRLDNKLDFEQAVQVVLNSFDIIIHTKRDVLGKRKIASIIEINPNSKDRTFDELFYYDYSNVHKSTGIIPRFYDDIKDSPLPVNENIFDKNYSHTYSKVVQKESGSENTTKKGANIEILKKFKKDLQNAKKESELKTQVLDNENLKNNENVQEDVKNEQNEEIEKQDSSQIAQENEAPKEQNQDNSEYSDEHNNGEILYNENL